MGESRLQTRGQGSERGLTDGDATVRAAAVDVALGDSGHADLVVGAGEEGGEGAGEHHVAVPNGATHGNTHLGDGEGVGVGDLTSECVSKVTICTSRHSVQCVATDMVSELTVRYGS